MPEPPMMPSTAFTRAPIQPSQMGSPEYQCPFPGEFRRCAVMRAWALLVHEAMVGVVAEEFKAPARGTQARLEGVDTLRGKIIILVCEMALQRHLHVGGLGDGLRRNAVEANCGAELGDSARSQDRHRPAHAESREPDLRAGLAQIEHGAAYRLIG